MLARYYPDRAAREGLNGSATVKCAVGIDSRLHDCAVITESPAGMGFGAATMRVLANTRFKPAYHNGAPVSGATISVPLNWYIHS